MQNGSREGVRQHLGLGLEDVADPVLIASHAQGEFSVTAATEFKMLADLDLLKLKRGWPRRTWAGDSLGHGGVFGYRGWTGCIDLVLRF